MARRRMIAGRRLLGAPVDILHQGAPLAPRPARRPTRAPGGQIVEALERDHVEGADQVGPVVHGERGRCASAALDVVVVPVVVLAAHGEDRDAAAPRRGTPRRRPAWRAGSSAHSTHVGAARLSVRMRFAVSVVTCRQAESRTPSSGRSALEALPDLPRTGMKRSAHSTRRSTLLGQRPDRQYRAGPGSWNSARSSNPSPASSLYVDPRRDVPHEAVEPRHGRPSVNGLAQRVHPVRALPTEAAVGLRLTPEVSARRPSAGRSDA